MCTEPWDGPASGHQLAVVAYRRCWLYWAPIGRSARAKKVAEGEGEEEKKKKEDGTEENHKTCTLTIGKYMSFDMVEGFNLMHTVRFVHCI